MVVPLEDYRYDALSCPRCSNCKWVDHVYVRSHRFAKICPINARYGFNAYSAHGMLDMALALLDGQLDYTPGLIDVVYKCTLCGACDVRCKRNLDLEVLLVLEGLRERCAQDEAGPLPQHKAVVEKVNESHNRYGAPSQKRIQELPGAEENADILYFVGCNHSYVQKETARATARVLEASGSKFALLGAEEWCCGRPLIATGQWELARKKMEHNLDTLASYGAKTVVTSCAECYKTWKVDYPRMLKRSTEDMDYRVLHIVEHAQQSLDAGTLSFKNPVQMKVTYHDPCHLGRLSEPWIHWVGERKAFGRVEPAKTYRRGTYGVYDPPRQILNSIPGIELVEMERVREHSWCCGAGGGVMDAFKDFALWTADERLQEAESSGVETVVTACPFCCENLGEAARLARDKINVVHIAELMLKALS